MATGQSNPNPPGVWPVKDINHDHPNNYSPNPLSGHPRHPSAVIWLTGLPSSGKSTIAESLTNLILDTGYNAVWWDGDVVRHGLCSDLGYSKEDRDENIRRIAWMARETARQGLLTVVSVVSPYVDARERARGTVVEAGARFVEVFVRCPLVVCHERDVKGLYGKWDRGEIKGMTGVDAPYEVPVEPEIVCQTHQEEVRESVWKVYSYIRREVWGVKKEIKMKDEE